MLGEGMCFIGVLLARNRLKKLPFCLLLSVNNKHGVNINNINYIAFTNVHNNSPMK